MSPTNLFFQTPKWLLEFEEIKFSNQFLSCKRNNIMRFAITFTISEQSMSAQDLDITPQYRVIGEQVHRLKIKFYEVYVTVTKSIENIYLIILVLFR